jgi:2-keto-4-pentenoate hydratase
MTPDQHQRAARHLRELAREGRRIAHLPEDLRPGTRAEGYAIQAHYETESAKPLFGWKIAATGKAGQAHINVDGPLAGRLLAERVFAPGATMPLKGNQMLVVEGEFAFRMGRDLAPRATPYTREEVLAAIDTLHPAIEVPNSRFEPFEKAGAAQLIADNACAEYFMLGEAAPSTWRSLDLVKHEIRGTDSKGAVHVGNGGAVLDDPLLALAWIANELSAIGVTLKAGEVVTTGTCFKPFAVAPGDRVTVDYGVLGSLSVSFSD